MSFMLLLDVVDIYFIHLVVKETRTLSLFILFCYGCYGDMNNSLKVQRQAVGQKTKLALYCKCKCDRADTAECMNAEQY